MPSIQLSCGSVAYSEWNPQSSNSTPIVFLHANPGCSKDFEGVIPAFVDAQYRVLALDFPGFGDSPASPTFARGAMFFFEVVKAWVLALDLPPSVIIGNSLGGNCAVRLAIAEPSRVKQLILVSPGGFTAHNIMTRTFCRFMGSPVGLKPATLARFYLGHRSSPVCQAMLRRARTDQRKPESMQVFRQVWTSFAQTDHDCRLLVQQSSALQAIDVMLVFGRHDPIIPWNTDGKEAAKVLPRAKFVVMDSGHAPFAEIPAEFVKLVVPFVHGALN